MGFADIPFSPEMPSQPGDHIAEGWLALFTIPGGSPACSVDILSRRAIGKVPEHYETIERQDERDSAGDCFFSTLFMRLRSRDLFVPTLAFGSAPPSVLRIFQAHVLFHIAVHLLLGPTQGEVLRDLSGGHLGVGDSSRKGHFILGGHVKKTAISNQESNNFFSNGRYGIT